MAAADVDLDFVEDRLVDESLVKLLSPQIDDAGWEKDEEYVSYLAQLTAYGLERLNEEPARLAGDKAQLLSETQSLAFQNYTSFISTHGCCRDVRNKFRDVASHVDSLSVRLVALEGKCGEFQQNVKNISERRVVNNLMLSHHPQLLEVLEIPQLMDTCVRNSYYNEALDLAAYVGKLAKKHARDVALVRSISEEVERSAGLMQQQLLGQLRSNIPLPACLAVVDHLRRLGAFSEVELRILFLQLRGEWLSAQLHAISSSLDDDAHRLVVKVLDANRVHLFDIITQYRAIFADEVWAAGRDVAAAAAAAQGSSLLHGWVVERVDEFLLLLESQLPRVRDGALMHSLLGQCMYFGMSLGRVGIDFRPLVVPYFEQAVGGFVSELLSAAMEAFVFRMRERGTALDVSPSVLVRRASAATVASSKDASAAAAAGAAVAPTTTSTATAPSSSSSSSSSNNSSAFLPPIALMDYTSLAVLTNSYVAAFNELRQCAMLSLRGRLAAHLRACLQVLCAHLRKHHSDYRPVFSDEEQRLFSCLCGATAEIFIPYVVECFRVVFEGSGTVGGGEVRLDLCALIRPLEGLYASAVTVPAPPKPLAAPVVVSNAQGRVAAAQGANGVVTAADLPTSPAVSASASTSAAGVELEGAAAEVARAASPSDPAASSEFTL